MYFGSGPRLQPVNFFLNFEFSRKAQSIRIRIRDAHTLSTVFHKIRPHMYRTRQTLRNRNRFSKSTRYTTPQEG